MEEVRRKAWLSEARSNGSILGKTIGILGVALILGLGAYTIKNNGINLR